jgi:hypothetical protein
MDGKVIDPQKQLKFNGIIRKKAEKNGDEFATVIDLSGKTVGDNGAQMIANFLNTYSYDIYTITILLDNCGITDEGVEILFGALFKIYKDNALKIEIRRISLQNNPITTKGVDYIMSILQSGETFYEGEGPNNYYSIQEIDLCGIQMTPADNRKYRGILYDYYINRAFSIYGIKLYSECEPTPILEYVETITPNLNFSDIYLDWQLICYGR